MNVDVIIIVVRGGKMKGGVRESLKILKMHEVTFIEQMDWLRTFPR